jgi:PAS domain S-box-containing protein
MANAKGGAAVNSSRDATERCRRLRLDNAALALSNARLLDEARRERAERTRSADRLRNVSEAAKEFSSKTDDLGQLLEIIARRLGEVVGDMCAIRPVSEDGEWLESVGAAYHRNHEVLAAMREIMGSGRQRVGEGVSGRVAATREPLLTRKIDPSAFAASSEPRYRPFLERLGVTSSIAVPLLCAGRVVGVANLLRSKPSPPYDEEDLHFVEGVADHAAIAIGNARLYAAERAAHAAADRATHALRQSEARFARLRDAGILGIIVTHLDGRVIEINDTLHQLVGYSRDEILSGHVAWTSLTPPDLQRADVRAVEQLRASGVASLREKEFVRKDGRHVPVLVGSAMLEGEAGECISFVLDLTERKQAEAVIARLRADHADDAKFRALLETAPDAMVIVDQGGLIALVNGRTEALFGYSRTELMGRAIDMLVADGFRQACSQDRATFFADPAPRILGAGAELFGQRKDGTEFPVEISLAPIETEQGVLVSSAIRDISERKNAERQRANLAAIVEASDDAIIGKTLGGIITSWNSGAHRIFGYDANEAVGRSIALIIPPGFEGEEPVILETLARGEVKRFDALRRCKDGRIIHVSVTSSPVCDGAGHVIGISKVARDITDRKLAAAALARAKDMADSANSELETFSYSVAHDLRAPLRGMNGFAQLVLNSYEDKLDERAQDWLREIVLNATKMGELIDGLLSLAHLSRSDLRPTCVNLSEIARDLGARLAALEPSRNVELLVEEGLYAEVDPRLARSLFDNLLANAWKFTRGVPAARVEVGCLEHESSRAFFVRDNGAGFDMAFADKLFVPFQRLHATSEFPGTGIGLATVQRIVHRHGGRVWATGTVDGGATFHFTLSRQAPEKTP